jgi:hypothetical protein
VQLSTLVVLLSPLPPFASPLTPLPKRTTPSPPAPPLTYLFDVHLTLGHPLNPVLLVLAGLQLNTSSIPSPYPPNSSLTHAVLEPIANSTITGPPR